MSSSRFELTRDRRGAAWDLLLYVPTVSVLGFLALQFWFDGRHPLAYLLAFLASFFLLAGANRILRTRLGLLPGSPAALVCETSSLRIELTGGKVVDLLKDIRHYADYAGRSFGLTGLDGQGTRHQFVLHRGQFAQAGEFDRAQVVVKARVKSGK